MTTKLNASIQNLFAERSGQTSTTGGNTIAYTNQLTSLSEKFARDIMTEVNNNPELHADNIIKSQKSHDDMDAFIKSMITLTDADVEFLSNASDNEIERMLRSQQSKRSRAKSKTMTIDNYLTLLTAGIAENLLRLASGKEKSNGGGLRKTDVTYNSEELQELAADQEKLRKAIRNVQSKKSIMKSKANFNEQSDEWQTLLIVEEQLKALRTGESSKAQEITNSLTSLVADADVDSMKANDAKELLKQIREALLTK